MSAAVEWGSASLGASPVKPQLVVSSFDLESIRSLICAYIYVIQVDRYHVYIPYTRQLQGEATWRDWRAELPCFCRETEWPVIAAMPKRHTADAIVRSWAGLGYENCHSDNSGGMAGTQHVGLGAPQGSRGAAP